jgi:hypothetical protein
MTGGEYRLFTSRKGFEERMVDFNNHLHSRYVPSFAPQRPHPGLHQIRVRRKEPSQRSVESQLLGSGRHCLSARCIRSSEPQQMKISSRLLHIPRDLLA